MHSFLVSVNHKVINYGNDFVQHSVDKARAIQTWESKYYVLWLKQIISLNSYYYDFVSLEMLGFICLA